ncbi:hypothetical protein FA95DRAFT_1507405 [Auriscalpium vulgare]|uniref:Uncharacterized protein n=1 Tax=Auriscalpium vulgare TaxID=40419 RepID=A0ACB8SCK7_9AGAM|nr:hypothetical protein FA95DRAFT_1507405 [Auriscalpium vulgare]
MKNDATEAALGLLGLTTSAVFSTVPLKRPSPDDEATPNSDAINCICGFGYDDGFSIACDDCSRWCHAACFDIVEGGVPEEWRCWLCVPRPVDRDRAIRLQKERQRLAIHAASEKRRRQASPGVDRKHRRQSALAIEGGSSTKRKRRASAAQPPTTSPEDEHVNIDEPWTHSYVPISQDIVPSRETRDTLRRQAQHWRGVTALSQPPPTPFTATPVQLSSLPTTSPTALHPLPSSSFSHPILSSNIDPSVRPPSYAMHTTHPVPSSKFITPFTSTIIPSSAYLSDPLNAYAHHGMPKPFVHLFGPPLDVALDARITGNEARFVRSGCRPNAVLRPVICPTAKSAHVRERADTCEETGEDVLTFGVFALRDLKANEEVVLGWEWDDGNAVHNLPALIETPHMFPPHQIDHLRHQMTAMLHALSSTFTTCACGSNAKDCALTLMAAFVDGQLPNNDTSPSPSDSGPDNADHESSLRKIDIGPLIGVERGFRTREKAPMSGGMSGVEVVSAGSVFSDRRNTVDVGSVTAKDSHLAVSVGRSTLPELRVSPATASPSPRKERKGKLKPHPNGISHNETSAKSMSNGLTPAARRKRRVTIDKQPPRSPSPSNSDIAIDSDEECKMPPKMRKRWIHRSTEALRATSQSASPSGSLVSLGSVMGPSEVDEMDIDRIPSLDSKDMPPPPMPATLDPTTISSISSVAPTSPSPRISISNLPSFSSSHQPQASPSPSTPFAKLSLLSPLVSDLTSPRSFPFGSPFSPKLSPSLLPLAAPRTPHSDGTSLTREYAGAGDEDAAMDVDQECAPTESSPESVDSLPTVSRSSPTSPALPSSISFSIRRYDPMLGENHTLSHSSEILASPLALTSPKSFVLEPPAEIEPRERTPSPSFPSSTSPAVSDAANARALTPPPPPQVPKVKMSLKDFALRKKKQREEGMTKVSQVSDATSPPVDDALELAGVEASIEAVSDSHELHASGNGSSTLEETRVAQAQAPISSDETNEPSSSNEPAGDAAELTTDASPNDVAISVADDSLEERPTVQPPAPAVEINESPSSPKGQQAAINQVLPIDEDGNRDSPSTLPPSPVPDDMVSNSSHTSAPEDGEVSVNTPAPRQPPSQPRSYSPPTQPRSFASRTASPSPTPTTTPHRLPPSSSYRTPTTTYVPPSSRPLPSGPRALRASLAQSAPVAPAAVRPALASYIPRGPSADRDRAWNGLGRGRGRGTSSTWGR